MREELNSTIEIAIELAKNPVDRFVADEKFLRALPKSLLRSSYPLAGTILKKEVRYVFGCNLRIVYCGRKKVGFKNVPHEILRSMHGMNATR